MSAYIVDDQTINRILAAARVYTHSTLSTTPPAPKGIIGPDPTFLHWVLLGGRLRDMNVAAVISRYGPSDPLPGPSPLLPYEYESISAPGPIQTISSLACYLYQCSEGDIPERRLYQQLRKWEAALCYHQVTQSDEWRQAEWA